jgi:predicted ribosomally synthesized peptide with SipW-like signal peptide
MKKKLIVVSTILLVALLIAGGSMAWFSDKSDEAVNEFKLGTVKVKVVEPGFEDLENVEATKYDKNVQVESLGTKKTYVRVRLVPQWSNSSLPVSNVQLNLASNNDWVHHTDGYYYFKYYLTQNQLTSLLLKSVTFSNLGPEHEGQTFSLKVVAEGVQITHEAWQDVWGLSSLPFPADQPWTP